MPTTAASSTAALASGATVDRLDALLVLLGKLRVAVAKVSTLDFLRRLCSPQALDLLVQLKKWALRHGPVVRERAVDVAFALINLNLMSAFRSPRRFLSALACELLDVLGGTAIKIAQVLAHSPGFVPQPLVDACRGSLAAARSPVVPAAALRKAVEIELGMPIEELFESFDDAPLASASIAQVHAATLRGSGEEVIVKVVRPGVRARLAADLELVVLLAVPHSATGAPLWGHECTVER